MPTFIHAKNSKVFVNAVDLSTYLKSFAYGIKVDTAPTTTFTATVKTYLVGLDGSTLALTGYYDGSASAVDAIFFAAMSAASPTIVTVSPSGSLALGARVFTGTSIETDYTVTGAIGTVVEISATFTGTPNIQPGFSLHDLLPETTTVTGTSIATGYTSTLGGVLVAHVTANTMIGTTALKVQTSVDNITFVDLLNTTVTVGVGATGAFSAALRARDLATINPYIRLVTTPASTGSITFTASFARF